MADYSIDDILAELDARKAAARTIPADHTEMIRPHVITT